MRRDDPITEAEYRRTVKNMMKDIKRARERGETQRVNRLTYELLDYMGWEQ